MHKQNTVMLLMFCLIGFGAALQPAPATADGSNRYYVTDLGVLPEQGDSSANAINDCGQITGGSGIKAFVWSAATGMVSLGDVPAGYDTSWGVDINASGQIAVGANRMFNSTYTGFAAYRWTSGVFEKMNNPGGEFTYAVGIDGQGRLLGTYSADGYHLYRSTTGTTLDEIDAGNPQYACARGANASGQLVGQKSTPSGQYRGFVWPGSGTGQDLPTLSQANAISDSGIIVGYSLDAPCHATIYDHGITTDMHALGTASFPYAVNDAAEAIGVYTDAQSYQHPFVWDYTSGMNDLNSLLEPITGAGWVLDTATDINSSGQIVGFGLHNGVGRAFLLTPVPEPCTVALLGCGVIGLLTHAWRKRRRGQLELRDWDA
jgi:uncharacterized membrane protein